MKKEVLELLRKENGYISGQEICSSLGVSRTAVWKSINQLKQEGYQIDAVQNKGYHLEQIPDVLSEAELSSRLRTDWAGTHIRCVDVVDSTNNRAKRLADEGLPHGTLVIAERQTAGKGRRGRQWTSPPGSGVWMSIILRPKIQPASASMLTLVVALAVCRGIRSVCGCSAQIKWPNDIVMGGKKICGILTEMSSEPDYINYVVAGIGINVNMKEFPQELEHMATSLFLQTGQEHNRASLICAVMEALEQLYGKFLEAGDLSVMLEEYTCCMANLDQQVRVLAPGNEYTGVARGITKSGELLVETEDGTVRRVLSGEVSVRGLYGYVQ